MFLWEASCPHPFLVTKNFAVVSIWVNSALFIKSYVFQSSDTKRRWHMNKDKNIRKKCLCNQILLKKTWSNFCDVFLLNRIKMVRFKDPINLAGQTLIEFNLFVDKHKWWHWFKWWWSICKYLKNVCSFSRLQHCLVMIIIINLLENIFITLLITSKSVKHPANCYNSVMHFT